MDTREYWINKIEDKNFYEDLALQFLFFNRQNFYYAANICFSIQVI